MRIIGVEVAGGPPVFAATLPHGSDPHRLAWAHGYRIVRPLSATGQAPELTLTVQVGAHHRPSELPPSRTRSIDADLDLAGLGHDPVLRQRVAAYGIVVSDRGLLATQFSELTAVPGLWGLPGGGVDPGESPSRALIREVAEEAGQELEISHLLDVQTDHWIGRSPTQVVEDFHAVRIIYTGRCLNPTDPVVIDVGGTTAAATWLSLDEWPDQQWSAWAKVMLDRHLPGLVAELG
ncbi:MAG: NUDIX domain-containing protein [Actinobacteria bacterium]|nr:NUDIX domain-containing protein [Actinomycetota bacterium]MBU4249278.1 NUDIX domain-containing protein [Actinomycetota bacterium]MBU4364811.1 NUDIX domain-containing protein [Actinomycetota bacterium]MBU4410679.1 NUDIX domain-containing protein [Actinomycetota bacterium]MBU4415710.1 NUDIX domain-containing protein [Actinomycetota bacterium]